MVASKQETASLGSRGTERTWLNKSENRKEAQRECRLVIQPGKINWTLDRGFQTRKLSKNPSPHLQLN